MTTSPIQILQKLGALLESRDLHDVSYRIPRVIRELNAAPTQEAGVEISDWNSFLDWWGKNRGQQLKYVFVDTFGEGSEEVQRVEELIDQADQHERALHDFYMMLRAKAQEQQAPISEPELKPEPGAPEESEDEEESEEEGDEEEKEEEESEDEAEDVDLDLESTE